MGKQVARRDDSKERDDSDYNYNQRKNSDSDFDHRIAMHHNQAAY